MLKQTFVYEDALQMADIYYATINVAFMDSFTEFCEDTVDIEDDRLFTEKHQATVGEALRIFLAGIINTLQKLKDSIKTEIEQRMFSADYRKKVEELRNQVLNSEKQGQKTVSMPDFRAACTLYEQMVDELLKKAKKIANIDYLTVNGLDRDIEKFYEVADEYDKKLTRVMNIEKEVPIAVALKFANEEAKGGILLKSLDKAMREFKKMESDVKRIETKEAIIGRDLITKKVVIIHKSSDACIKSIRKWIAKMIGKFVFYFA